MKVAGIAALLALAPCWSAPCAEKAPKGVAGAKAFAKGSPLSAGKSPKGVARAEVSGKGAFNPPGNSPKGAAGTGAPSRGAPLPAEKAPKGVAGAKAPSKGASIPAEKSLKGVTGEGRKNLIANGDFEAGGKSGPASWQRPDNLTSFWVDAPGRKGKCIKIDTDVPNDQFRQREDEMEKARSQKREPPPPPRRRPTSASKYDTVGGNDGVHFGCDPFPADPKKHYLLEADARVEGAKGSPKVWVKAYGMVKSRDLTRERELWKKALVCNDAGPEWKTFRMVFPHNTSIPEKTTTFRIYLYPFWPAAVYHFDNVRLVEITEEEVKAFVEEHGLLEKSPKR